MTLALDHYVGRKVTGVNSSDDLDVYAWEIVVEGGAQIRSHADNPDDMPHDILGYVLVTVIMHPEHTTLVLAPADVREKVKLGEKIQIDFNPLEYSIIDAQRSEEEVWPQVGMRFDASGGAPEEDDPRYEDANASEAE